MKSFLSNFYESEMVYRGRKFKCAEAAYQSEKCWERVDEFMSLNGREARKLGRSVRLRRDWEKVKVGIMKEVLRAKFRDEKLRLLLEKTGNKRLVHVAPWDGFWGLGRDGKGKNMLGKLLMEVRDEIRR